ncbi:ATP-binding cassette domain-containing protein [Guggenheimella bovis]
MRPTLEVKHLSRRYGEGCPHCQDRKNLIRNFCPVCKSVYALDDVSLEVYKGEILGIVGESGSGKSTLMKLIYFDDEATSGTYHIEGSDNLFLENDQKKRYIRNHTLAMVYQNPLKGLKMHLSAISNIAEKLISSGERRADYMIERGIELLERVQIPAHRMKESPQNFSGGMQQRVQIAKALSNNPPILFLDEVTTGLDLSVQASVLDLILSLQRELKMTMIVVSHDLAVVRMLAERTIVMKDGRIVESGLTDQILEDPIHPYTQELVYSLL